MSIFDAVPNRERGNLHGVGSPKANTPPLVGEISGNSPIGLLNGQTLPLPDPAAGVTELGEPQDRELAKILAEKQEVGLALQSIRRTGAIPFYGPDTDTANGPLRGARTALGRMNTSEFGFWMFYVNTAASVLLHQFLIDPIFHSFAITAPLTLVGTMFVHYKEILLFARWSNKLSDKLNEHDDSYHFRENLSRDRDPVVKFLAKRAQGRSNPVLVQIYKESFDHLRSNPELNEKWCSLLEQELERLVLKEEIYRAEHSPTKVAIQANGGGRGANSRALKLPAQLSEKLSIPATADEEALVRIQRWAAEDAGVIEELLDALHELQALRKHNPPLLISYLDAGQGPRDTEAHGPTALLLAIGHLKTMPRPYMRDFANLLGEHVLDIPSQISLCKKMRDAITNRGILAEVQRNSDLSDLSL